MKIGIDDMAFTAPALALPIKDLAEARNIEYDKLRFGLGLKSMAVCDADEDVITLASTALIHLLQQNENLNPRDIGRIYVGTESSIDGSKPIASYVHEIANQYFNSNNQGENSLRNCDVIDMTFACIGAVDAMHNSLDYLACNPTKTAIVIAADIANYDLGSPGEYTQGAGATAILLKANPRLISFHSSWGVAMKSEHDFFKPVRLEVLNGEVKEMHDEKPIYDGHLSNETYKQRIEEAWENYATDSSISEYDYLVFHLPYAYHGRRVISSLFEKDLKTSGLLEQIYQESEIDINTPNTSKQFAKSDYYKQWVKKHVSGGEVYSSDIGNLYTASIFLSLMSTLKNNPVSHGQSVLFFAYGSGSKAKVFSGTIEPGISQVIARWNLDRFFDESRSISFSTYIDLRSKKVSKPIAPKKLVVQLSSGVTATNRYERGYSIRA
ncbi:MAG: hydroxymethylglutaryl-CoA synthase family protein [Bacteroidetes bacterium]|jgi:hydroxymethylglutaryl-CoA synthase|nr:hydroxymethylglutaryl-CoA synthase family protein [Bacteroidota bacterium]